eukprot:15355933-Ditylum_brightwellii.AAC.1
MALTTKSASAASKNSAPTSQAKLYFQHQKFKMTALGTICQRLDDPTFTSTSSSITQQNKNIYKCVAFLPDLFDGKNVNWIELNKSFQNLVKSLPQST